MDKTTEQTLRQQILDLTRQYCEASLAGRPAFEPGDRVAYGGRVYDGDDMTALVDSALDFWLTAGRYVDRFEKEFAEYLGIQHCITVNSGSSANLLAFMALTSPLLGDRRIRRGDEVITVAAGFPTTVAPIVQYGAIPVFIDVAIPQYNIDCSRLDAALSDRTRAVMVAHTLGNPFDLRAVKAFCDRNGLWLIEDNCDALGSRYDMGNGKMRFTGTIGDIGTSSFYPPHHMTMGEGGAVYTNNPLLHRILLSMRDWGRDCWCPPGRDNTCRHRFDRQYGRLPLGYDHKYVYSHFGYNLKITEMQAAVGCEQLRKLPSFTACRKENYAALRAGLSPVEDCLVLPEPAPHADPSWFGFLITVRQDAPFRRDDLVRHLEESNIQTRMLFAGNITKHPAFDDLLTQEGTFRIAGGLEQTDRIMNDTFWIGVYPGMDEARIQYMCERIVSFVQNSKNH